VLVSAWVVAGPETGDEFEAHVRVGGKISD
jgi:hypothetical protein